MNVHKKKELAVSTEDDAARQALEDILRDRKQFAALLRTAEFQQMPLEHQIPLISLAAQLEGALEMLALHHKQALEARDRVATRLQGSSSSNN
jgi:hypothetical protein